MNNLVGFFRKMYVLKFKDYLQIIEALFSLILINGLIFFFPLRWWYKWIGQINKSSHKTSNFLKKKTRIYRIKKNIIRANKILLQTSKCFAISLTFMKMLKRREIYGTLYLGIAKNHNKELIAHAWLKYENCIIYGGNFAEKQYQQMIYFS